MTTAINAIAEAPDSRSARVHFVEAGKQEGFSAAYFERIQSAFGDRPIEAARLSAHWRLLLQYGDDAALAYRAKGVSDRLAGRWIDSAKAFLRAGTEAADSQKKLSYQVGAIDALARAGKVSEAVALGKNLVTGLDKIGQTGLAGRVRLNLGHALLWADRYSEARKWLEEAIPALEEGGYAPEGLYARLSLSTAELYGGSVARAQDFAELAKTQAVALGLEYAGTLCDINVAQSTLIRGGADLALNLLLDVRPRLADSPTDAARVSEFIGDVYFKLNLWNEAIDAYDEALAQGRHLPALNIAACLLGRGQAMMAIGQFKLAITTLRNARRRFWAAGNVAWASSADTWIAKALFELGQSRAAQTKSISAASEARKGKSPWHEVEALLTHIECGGTTGLRRASHLIKRQGYVSQSWRVVAARSDMALPANRLRSYRKTLEAILASRLLTASPISRTNFLRDKGRHITAYLDFLLARPTPRRIDEAISVISRCRSSALLDEILSSQPFADLPAEKIKELDRLRAELRELEVEGQLPNGSRRGPKENHRIASLQRRWVEASHNLALTGAPNPQSEPAALVLTQTANHFAALNKSSATPLKVTARGLDDDLRWLRFELLAPLMDRDADPAAASALIAKLARDVVQPWFVPGSNVVAICPDRQLWQVPWTTCVAELDPNCEVVLALHPALAKVSTFKLARDSKIMLWVDQAHDLPHTNEEERAFLGRFPDARVCRSAREAIDSFGEAVDLLHVIGHAHHNASNPMFSALRFSDGSLYAAQIAQSNLRAKIVTLAACDTGVVSTAIREEADGLARSFLARGAETVIGSLWPLDDESATRLYSVLFRNLIDGASLPEALNSARNTLRRWRSHPYFWGSLALFGGYER